MTAVLPQPRNAPYRVTMICLGNICRSPMAEVVLSDRVAAAGLTDRVSVDSCGTGSWHIGDQMNRRAAATLTAAGYDATRHRAKQLERDWPADDLLLAMDSANLADVQRVLGRDERILLFRDFDPLGPGDVPDPYYGPDSGFAEVLTMVERTADELIRQLAELAI